MENESFQNNVVAAAVVVDIFVGVAVAIAIAIDFGLVLALAIAIAGCYESIDNCEWFCFENDVIAVSAADVIVANSDSRALTGKL